MDEPLEDCPIVYLDGTWLKLKRIYADGSASVENECVLVALGIKSDGRKAVLGFRVLSSEGSGVWKDFLEDLRRRGCRNPAIFVTDGLNEMDDAIARVFPKARHQRCIVHLCRNICKEVRKKERPSLAEESLAVFEESLTEEADELAGEPRVPPDGDSQAVQQALEEARGIRGPDERGEGNPGHRGRDGGVDGTTPPSRLPRKA